MKDGVLSNFTRSHISSDRVRSGYEIRSDIAGVSREQNVDAILSYFSFKFTEKFQSSLCSESHFVQW